MDVLLVEWQVLNRVALKGADDSVGDEDEPTPFAVTGTVEATPDQGKYNSAHRNKNLRAVICE